jgi:hypothetical protein
MDTDKLLNPSYITTIQHTCMSKGTNEFIEQNAPFFAKVKSAEEVDQFLGSGYYFWDNHIEMAHRWGKDHYQNKYTIVESSAYIGLDVCLDLVGCRAHMKALHDLEQDLLHKNVKKKQQWTVGECIEFLKELDDKNVFPYEVIRAVDQVLPKKFKQQAMFFVTKTNHFTVLNPKIALCFLNKDVLLQPISIIYQN